MAATQSSAAATAPEAEAEVEHHEQDVEDREAFEYWGFMFKSDKTGTDRLKALLRGLKDVMVGETALSRRLSSRMDKVC